VAHERITYDWLGVGKSRNPVDYGTPKPVLRMRTDRVAQFLSELQARQLLVTSASGPVKPHNGDVRQPRSDRVAERVRRYRQRSSTRLDRLDVRYAGTGPPFRFTPQN
jgi:hypothetical protein